jgi:hypothetical protein
LVPSKDRISQDDSGTLRAKTLFDYFDETKTDPESANWMEYQDWQRFRRPQFGFSSQRDFDLVCELIMSGTITRQKAYRTFKLFKNPE